MPRKGRPRDDSRTRAILEAAHEVFRTQGWNHFTMDDIAKAAGCGLATIYRRWSTKEELAAAVMAQRAVLDIEETGDALTDLHAFVVALATDLEGTGSTMLGFLEATRNDPVMREAFEAGYLGVGRPKLLGFIAQVLGEDSPHLAFITDAVGATILMRITVLDAEQDPQEYADEVLAMVTSLAAT